MTLEAFFGIVGPALVAVLSAIALWIRSMSCKIDENTKLTRIGIDTAAIAATDAKNTAELVSERLNGGIERTVEAAIKPLRDEIRAHALKDESNMEEIRKSLYATHTHVVAELSKRVR